MKVSGSPPIYCFLLLNYHLNLVAQFDKLLPRNSEKFWSTPEDQTERKNDRFETPRLRDPSKTLLRFRDRAKIFWDPRQFFEVPFYTPTFKIGAAYLRFDLLQRSLCTKITVLLSEQAAIRNDFRASVLKSYTVNIRYTYVYKCRDTATRQEQMAMVIWPVRPR